MSHVISYLGRVKSVHQITVVQLIHHRLIARDSTLVGYMGAYRPGSVSRQITRWEEITSILGRCPKIMHDMPFRFRPHMLSRS